MGLRPPHDHPSAYPQFSEFMRETWLHTNRRALWFGTSFPLLLTLLGAGLAWSAAAEQTWLKWLGLALVAIGACLVAVLLAYLRRPRIAYDDGQVLFHLQNGPPIAVPVELVEAFFIGQSPLMLRGAPQHDVTVNLIARISQRDPNYAKRDVRPALGAWCDSYVTIRGTWCEPLDGEVVRRLNRRLREVSEERARSTAAG
jgi:hypothetical protein